MRRSRFLAGGLALAGAASALPARAQVGMPYVTQLFIGVNVPLSGPYAPYGERIVAGARAATDYSNRYQGPLERTFGIRTYDDQNALAISITNAQFIAGDQSVLACIGNLTTEVTVGSLPEYANDQTPLVVPASTADEVTGRGYRNIFRLPTKDVVEGQLFARTVLANVRPAFALAVTQDGTYGPDVAKGFVAQAAVDKHKADVYQFSEGKPDYTAAAAAIVAQKPDYVFLAGKTGAMGPLVPALVAAGYTGGFGLSDGFYDVSVPKKYGTPLRGAWVATSFPPLQRVPSDFTVLADLQRQIGPVDAFSAYGYAAAQVIMEAVKRTNAQDKAGTLRALTAGDTYQTLTGTYHFDFNGDPIDPNLYFFSVQSDGFKFEKPAHPTGFVL